VDATGIGASFHAIEAKLCNSAEHLLEGEIPKRTLKTPILIDGHNPRNGFHIASNYG